MTERYNAVLVIFAEDIHQDDFEPLASALRQFKNVLSVEPHPRDYNSAVAEARIREQLCLKVLEVLNPVKPK